MPNIGNSPGIDFQEHRIGPVLYYEKELAGEKEGHLRSTRASFSA